MPAPVLRRRLFGRALAWALRIGAVAMVALATMTGLDASPDRAAVAARLARALHPGFHARDVLDAMRNIALLAGVGVVWIATARATASGGRLRREVAIAGVVGLVLGLMAETAQLFSPTRTSSILDVLTNGLGALLGAALVANVIAYGARDAWRRTRHRTRPLWLPRTGHAPLLYVAVPYTAACWLEAFSPFGRPDRVPDAWGGPGHRWLAALPYAREHLMTLPAASDVLLFVPAGVLLTLWGMERGVPRWVAASVVAAGLAISWAAAELLRGITGGDMLVWAVAVHALASALGALLAAFWTQRVETTARVPSRHSSSRYALPAFAALLLIWSWRPFVLVSSGQAVRDALTPQAFTPMTLFTEMMTVHSVADVGVSALLFAPLGAWLAARTPPSATAGGLRALWPGFVVALLAEGGQVFIAGRTFDITDALVECVGVLVGAVIWRAADARARTHGPSAKVWGTPVSSTRAVR